MIPRVTVTCDSAVGSCDPGGTVTCDSAVRSCDPGGTVTCDSAVRSCDPGGTNLGFSSVTWLRRKLLASVMVVPWDELEDVEEEAR